MKQEYQSISQSFWIDDFPLSEFPKLETDIAVDVAIVGGGITGITLAYLLSKTHKVAVIDNGPFGLGDTGHTTAHLTWNVDGFMERVKTKGIENAKLVLDAHAEAIDLIQAITQIEKIRCDFERVDGFLYLGPEDDAKTLREEYDKLQEAGAEVVIEDMDIGFYKGPAIRYMDQAQFHPLKFLYGLIKASEGVQFFSNTQAVRFEKNAVITESGTINANYIVSATHSPINEIGLYFKEAPYRTYVVAGLVPKGSVPKGLFWDTHEPYHYIRTHPVDETTDVLIAGGEDHKTGQGNEKEHFTSLEKWTIKNFPMMKKINYRWSGQVLEPFDHMAIIGKSPSQENLFLATGFSGNGMTHGVIAAAVIRDMIIGRKNKLISLYDPARIPLTAETVTENVNAVSHLIGGQITGGEGGKILRKGEGYVENKIAHYKDDNGITHTFSAVCPHMGCIVGWNNSEKSFDCPCHGSRFSCYGKVLNGPSSKDLEPK